MANLTYLGDACVLWNSVVRYKNQLITPTLVSSVLLSIHTNASQSTLFAPWSCMLAREEMSAGLTSLPLLREPTRVCALVAAISPFLLLVSLELEKLRTPKRSSHTLLLSAPLAKGRREKPLLKTRLCKLTLFLKLGVMPRL